MERTLCGIRVGKVTQFNSTRGYGFIEDIETNASVFAHYTSLSRTSQGFRGLWEGEYVEFVVLQDHTGRPSARFVTGIRGGPLMCESRMPAI